ncbi:hypothetical protein LWI28_012464 [Acer negundo]|uniref:Uncharacterized protein n=1 Tax=Acer negundo TaxID=4023 RepID=A0AAD5IHF4_ACENE|nr:hypothetical protein LWI28_012464 [Acer negundo]
MVGSNPKKSTGLADVRSVPDKNPIDKFMGGKLCEKGDNSGGDSNLNLNDVSRKIDEVCLNRKIEDFSIMKDFVFGSKKGVKPDLGTVSLNSNGDGLSPMSDVASGLSGVLTVNQVFEILIKFLKPGIGRLLSFQVIPQRKRGEVIRRTPRVGGGGRSSQGRCDVMMRKITNLREQRRVRSC